MGYSGSAIGACWSRCGRGWHRSGKRKHPLRRRSLRPYRRSRRRQLRSAVPHVGSPCNWCRPSHVRAAPHQQLCNATTSNAATGAGAYLESPYALHTVNRQSWRSDSMHDTPPARDSRRSYAIPSASRSPNGAQICAEAWTGPRANPKERGACASFSEDYVAAARHMNP